MFISLNRNMFRALFVLAIFAGLPAQGAEGTNETTANDAQVDPNLLHREGVVVKFSATPTKGVGNLMAQDWADITFSITDEATGEPIKGRYPAAWMDIGEAWDAKGGRPMDCRAKVETYLKGIVGVRPMINLNDHFLLVMNRDASISVIDPAVGITGITNLFAQITLDRPAADWAKTEDQKKLFATMPLANQVDPRFPSVHRKLLYLLQWPRLCDEEATVYGRRPVCQMVFLGFFSVHLPLPGKAARILRKK